MGARAPADPPAETYTVALDPGTLRAGAAVYRGQRLVWAYLSKEHPGKLLDRAYVAAFDVADRLLAECPFLLFSQKNTKIYAELPRVIMRGGSRTPGDPDSILALVLLVGAFSTRLVDRGFSTAENIRPADWKTQVEKKAMTARIESCLAPCEIAVLESFRGVRNKKIDHNVLDAVGVGMKPLKRIPIAGTPIQMWQKKDSDFK